jgi:calcineurin-like phosphoesterase family protein
MNEALLTYHNEIVKPKDHVTLLGDVTMLRGNKQNKEKFIKEMRKYNGHKRLHLGNHDHFPVSVYLDAGFEKVYATWRDEDHILYSHIPIHPQSLGSAMANVHGHTHDNDSPEPGLYTNAKAGWTRPIPYVNICVERTDYRPVHIDQLKQMIRQAANEWDGSSIDL